VQPQTEIKGMPRAEAMCIAPVSPPMAKIEFLRMWAVSLREEDPQNDVMLLSVRSEIREEAMVWESGPPTIAMWIFREEKSRQIALRVESGMAFPKCAAPGAIVIYEAGR